MKASIQKIIVYIGTTVIVLVFIVSGWLTGKPIQQLSIQLTGDDQMFDPLQSALAALIVEGLQVFSQFLRDKGLPFDISGWGIAAAAALAALFIAVGNLFGAKLPPDFQAWMPYIVKFILTFLSMVGFHAVALKPLRSVIK